MFDSRLSPARDAATLALAGQNLQTLMRYEPSPRLRPHLLAGLGLFASMQGNASRALDFLRQAERLKPPPSLLQRIWLEQAAVRDGLGQHALAARLYGRIAAQSGLPPVLRANALLAQAQAQKSGGAIADLPAQLEQFSSQPDLPPAWRDWLRAQAGE